MRAVFYGSSTITGAGLANAGDRFSSLLCRILGWEERNLGITGSLVTGRDLDAQIISQESGVVRVPDVIDEKPDIIIILYGYDDVAAETLLGAPGDFRPGTFSSDYDSIIRGIAGGCGIEKMLVMTLEFSGDAAEPYNDVIRKLAERYGVKLFDAAAVAAANREVFTAPAAAPYSLGAEAHKILAEALGEFLKRG